MSFIFRKTVMLMTAYMFVSTLYASETRVATMGGNGYYMRDNSNIFIFPGAFYQYKKQAIAELRVKNNDQYYTIGVHLPVDTLNVAGVYFNRPMSLYLPSIGLEHVRLDRVTTVLYGRKMQDFDAGLGISLGFDSYTDESSSDTDPQINEGARYIALHGGLSNEKMDLGGKFELPHLSRDVDSLSSTVSGFNLGVNGRYFYQWQRNIDLIPLAVANYGSATAETDNPAPAANTKIDYKNLTFALGLGANYNINSKNLLVLGLEAIGFYQNTMEVKDGPKNTNTTMTIPGIYMGIESNISKWFTGRLGAAQVYQKLTDKTELGGDSMENSEYRTQFRLSFGLGINLGKFLLDASINEGLLFDGPNFISGTGEVLANRLSLTYMF